MLSGVFHPLTVITVMCHHCQMCHCCLVLTLQCYFHLVCCHCHAGCHCHLCHHCPVSTLMTLSFLSSIASWLHMSSLSCVTTATSHHCFNTVILLCHVYVNVLTILFIIAVVFQDCSVYHHSQYVNMYVITVMCVITVMRVTTVMFTLTTAHTVCMRT